jgi:hypothetical protein
MIFFAQFADLFKICTCGNDGPRVADEPARLAPTSAYRTVKGTIAPYSRNADESGSSAFRQKVLGGVGRRYTRRLPILVSTVWVSATGVPPGEKVLSPL